VLGSFDLAPVTPETPLTRAMHLAPDHEVVAHPTSLLELSHTGWEVSCYAAADIRPGRVVVLEPVPSTGGGFEGVVREGSSFAALDAAWNAGRVPRFEMLVGGDGNVAVATGPGRWSFRHQGTLTILVLPSGTRAVGVGEGASLVAVDADQRAIVVLQRHGAPVIARAAAPITDACVAAASGRVAYVTSAGELAVHRIKDGEQVLHVRGGGE
jgi:hypothetical protein